MGKIELEKDWWKKAVIYQIYPRSFQDTNHDGVGDLQGIIKRLDYLKKLGINAVWLSPVFRSPQDDNGYDISDYDDIDPLFGTIDDMQELIDEAKKREIYILMDLVVNHSSDEHRWFVEAKKSRENPYHDYYVWQDGEEGVLPNDLKAAFGGSAWEWVPELKQYYFHQFSVKQPDLNWENPKLRQEIYDMVNRWIDRGVGGFRLDVIELIAKEPMKKITANGPKLHEYIRELSANTFQRANLVTVGETWNVTPETAKLYSNPDGSELSMIFQFDHINLDQVPGKEKWDLQPLDFVEMKRALSKWQTTFHHDGWNSLFWDNHDLPRIVSRWGNDGEYRVESAKMFALLLHGMQGTPYIYEGEELGMTNVSFELEEYRDIESLNMYKERIAAGYSHEELMESIHCKGRDNARTPMQWNDGPNAGFTEESVTPWIRVNPNYKEINAQKEVSDPDSVFCFYQKLVALRKEYEILVEGDYRLLLEEDPQIFAYERSWNGQKLLVIANFGGETVTENVTGAQEGKKLLISNYKDEKEGVLRPYEAKMYLV